MLSVITKISQRVHVNFLFAFVKVNSISALQVQLDQAETDRSFKPSTVWASSTIVREKSLAELQFIFKLY
jgi:hypothetical protein